MKNFSIISLLVFVFLLPVSVFAKELSKSSLLSQTLNLYVGEVRTLKVQGITRVAVGNDELIATSIVNDNELMLIPKTAGTTEIFIWFKGNRRAKYKLNISQVSAKQLLGLMKKLFKPYSTVNLSFNNGIIFANGQVNATDYKRLSTILQNYNPLVVNLLQVSEFDEVRALLGNINGLEINLQSGLTTLTGSIAEHNIAKVEAVIKRYPNILNLAEVDNVEMKAMVSIQVELLEIQKNALEEIGIKWDNIIAGPTAGFTGAPITNDAYRILADGIDSSMVTSIPLSDGSIYGYLGLTTTISSSIQLLAETGQARFLARPTLNTRSGEEANFHAGGEIPYPVKDGFGQVSIEFKSYGVLLSINPLVGDNGFILTTISAEVSNIDNANAVDGVPGLLSRKVNSVVNGKSGETIVLSGLVQASDSISYSKVPWLGDIPYLGTLFRSKSFQNKRSELVILITPTIMGGEMESRAKILSETVREGFGNNGYIDLSDGILE